MTVSDLDGDLYNIVLWASIKMKSLEMEGKNVTKNKVLLYYMVNMRSENAFIRDFNVVFFL